MKKLAPPAIVEVDQPWSTVGPLGHKIIKVLSQASHASQVMSHTIMSGYLMEWIEAPLMGYVLPFFDVGGGLDRMSHHDEARPRLTLILMALMALMALMLTSLS